MNSINFDNAYLLLIAIPLIVLFTIPFLLAVRKDNRNGHNIASQIMHVVMAIIIAFAAAGTSITTVLTETNVYIVADVSYSANKNLDTIDNYISRINLPRNSKVGLICFGKDYQLISGLTSQRNLPSVKDAKVDDSETDIANALEYAGSLFNTDVIKRVVLITDGRQTDETDTYAIKRAVDSLEALDVKVDAIYLDDNINENNKEVQVSNAEFTRSTYKDNEEYVTVTVQSTYSTDKGSIMLYYDGMNYDEVSLKEIPLVIGTNVFKMDLDTSKSGVHDYEIVAEVEGDTSNFNNNYRFTQTVSDEKKVLIVSADWRTCSSLIEQYADKAIVDAYDYSSGDSDIATWLSTREAFVRNYADNENVNIYLNYPEGAGKVDVPVTIEELCKYDEFVLAEVDVAQITNFTKFIGSLEKSVLLFGKSLVTVGDVHIQDTSPNDTDEIKNARKQLSDMLPVRFGKNSEDPTLHTVIIDISPSMMQSYNLNIAKEAAEYLVSTMADNDYICLIAFYGSVEIKMPAQQILDKDSINEIIDGLEKKQGTLIGQGLSRAYEHIKNNNNFKEKKVWLISDGYEFASAEVDAVNVANQMRDDGIIVSVIDVGRGLTEPDDEAEQAAQLLKDIAGEEGEPGSGVYFNNDIYGSVEHFNDKDFDVNGGSSVLTETIIERETSVQATKRAQDELFSDENISEVIPDVSGFVNNSTKASAVTLLELNYLKSVSSSVKQIPLYSYWNYGNGKVSSFTSSFKKSSNPNAGTWLANWQNSDYDKPFFDWIMDSNTPVEKTDFPCTFEVLQENSSTQVRIIPVPGEGQFGTSVTIEIRTPDMTEDMQPVSRSLALSTDGTEYFYEFPTSDVGRYEVKINYSYTINSADDENSKTYNYPLQTILNVSYASEYNEFAAFEASPLFKALNGRGDVSTDGSLTLVNDENDMGTYKMDYTIPLLILCVILYVVDIVVRKLKWEDIVSFFGGMKKANVKKSADENSTEDKAGG